MNWLDPALDATTPTSRTLVLCRTGDAVTAVRRHVAARGGVAGLSVMTPGGLAAALSALAPPLPEPDPEATPSGALWDRIGPRPGLQRRLLALLEAARVGGVAPGDLPPELAEALRTAPPPGEGTRCLLALQARAAANGSMLGLGHDADRVLALGFGGVDDLPRATSAGRWEARLLAALGATRVAAPRVQAGAVTVPAARVADVVAEARGVAAAASAWAQAGRSLSDVLVLTASEADADRIRGALSRAGLPATDDGAQGWREHALPALLHRVLPWFGGGAGAVIEGEDLRLLLQSRLLKGGWDGAAEDAAAGVRAQAAALVDGDSDPMRASRARVGRVLRAAHRARGTAAAWQADLMRAAGDAGQPRWLRRQALVLSARLAALAACQPAGAGTLGDVLSYLRTFGVQLRVEGATDVIARGLLDALEAARGRPATRFHLDEVVAGAAGSGAVHDGVVLLGLDDYDGRGAGLLLLTGLHGKGVGRAPAPDPFARDAETARRLAVPGGAEVLDHRERLLAAAVRRAGEAQALVAARAADGRATAPYLHLSAVHGGPNPVTFVVSAETLDSFGLDAETPEWADLARLDRRATDPPMDDAWPDPRDRVTHLARMASAEWVRAGAAVAGFQADDGPRVTLGDWDRAFSPALPPALRPWCGDTTHTADPTGLPPDTVLSASGTLEPLLHCRFQVLAKARLGLREPEELSEDVDARDVGTAVHAALADTGPLRVDPADVDTARQALTQTLRSGSSRRIDALPAATPGLAAARDGLRERWAAHWPTVAAHRVSALDVDKHAAKAVRDALATTEHWRWLLDHAESWFDRLPKPWAPQKRRSTLGTWLSAAAATLADGQPIGDLPVSPLPKTQAAPLAAWLMDPDVQAAMQCLADEHATHLGRARLAAGPVVATAAEWSVGDAQTGAPLAVRFGTQDALVQGSVDRLFAYGTETEQVVEVLDYKTGGKSPGAEKLAEMLQSGARAQVPAYAVVVRAALRAGQGPPGFVAEPRGWRLGYDHLKSPSGPPIVDAEPNDISLDAVAARIGTQLKKVRAGDWLAVPHADTCPALNEQGHDYCRFADVCRVRAHPGGLRPLTDDDTPDEDSP